MLDILVGLNSGETVQLKCLLWFNFLVISKGGCFKFGEKSNFDVKN